MILKLTKTVGLKKGVVKRLLLYTLFLIYVDFFINIAINIILKSPGSVIVASVILRAIFLSVLLPLVGGIASFLFKKLHFRLLLIITSVVICILIPVSIYSLISNPLTVFDVYVDFHTSLDLFMIVFVPYIMASTICIVLSKRLELATTVIDKT